MNQTFYSLFEHVLSSFRKISSTTACKRKRRWSCLNQPQSMKLNPVFVFIIRRGVVCAPSYRPTNARYVNQMNKHRRQFHLLASSEEQSHYRMGHCSSTCLANSKILRLLPKYEQPLRECADFIIGPFSAPCRISGLKNWVLNCNFQHQGMKFKKALVGLLFFYGKLQSTVSITNSVFVQDCAPAFFKYIHIQCVRKTSMVIFSIHVTKVILNQKVYTNCIRKV